MKWLSMLAGLVVLVFLVLFVVGAVGVIAERQAGAESVVKYPKEEVVAQQLCGRHRLMYWWLESPRKASATMHARCTGQVTVVKEVDL